MLVMLKLKPQQKAPAGMNARVHIMQVLFHAGAFSLFRIMHSSHVGKEHRMDAGVSVNGSLPAGSEIGNGV